MPRGDSDPASRPHSQLRASRRGQGLIFSNNNKHNNIHNDNNNNDKRAEGVS